MLPVQEINTQIQELNLLYLAGQEIKNPIKRQELTRLYAHGLKLLSNNLLDAKAAERAKLTPSSRSHDFHHGIGKCSICKKDPDEDVIIPQVCAVEHL
jgi:hypothetical protein